MKKQKYILFSLPIVIILMVVTLIIISKKQSEFLYCSPTTPRENDLIKWQEITTPKSHNVQYDSEFIGKFQVSSDNEKYTLKYPDIRPPEDPFAYEIHELVPGEPLEIGGGILEFHGLGVAFQDANHIVNDEVPYKFFNTKLQPEIPENPNALWYYRMTEQDSHYQYNISPIVQLGFEHEGIEDIMFNSVKAFDARTYKEISLGFGSSGSDSIERSFHRLTINIHDWHRTPIDIVMDISFGPSKIFEFQPKTGEGFKLEGFKLEGFECRLINILEDINPHNYGETGYNNMKFFEFFKATPTLKGLRFIFACLPTAKTMPLTFSFLDKNGKNLPGAFTSTTDYIHALTFSDQPLEDIANIQVKYRTNRYRIVMHLPYVPGLPEENNNIDNLFDVHIPYVKFDNADRLNRFLYTTLQLSHLRTSGTIKANNTRNISFPIVFTDVTIGDIVKQYITGAKLNADIENDILEIKYPIPFLTKLKMLFYRIRQKNNE